MLANFLWSFIIHTKVRVMKKIYLFFLISVVVLSGCTHIRGKNQATNEPLASPQDSMGTLSLTSSVFEPQGIIPSRYTCDGKDVNPPLSITGVPQGTQSFVLIVDDPDAPSGDFVHWVVWNISAFVNDIPENSVPEGAVQGMTDFGRTGWGGPCPPSGTHRYQFKVYALGTSLSLTASSKKKDVESAMAGHILDETVLVGTYKRR